MIRVKIMAVAVCVLILLLAGCKRTSLKKSQSDIGSSSGAVTTTAPERPTETDVAEWNDEWDVTGTKGGSGSVTASTNSPGSSPSQGTSSTKAGGTSSQAQSGTASKQGTSSNATNATGTTANPTVPSVSTDPEGWTPRY